MYFLWLPFKNRLQAVIVFSSGIVEHALSLKKIDFSLMLKKLLGEKKLVSANLRNAEKNTLGEVDVSIW